MNRVCELCEQERASVVCSADAVMLCETCDADIHPVNTRMGHHLRIPLSFSLHHCNNETDCPLYGKDSSDNVDRTEIATLFMQNLRASPCSDSRLNPNSNPNPNPSSNSNYYEGLEELEPESSSTDYMLFCVDEYLDMEYVNSMDRNTRDPSQANIAADANNLSNSNDAKPLTTSSTPAMMSSTQTMTDRETRVMRYKEKKKNRKFEKKIRYASRKVYAEMRPRIKGRFVKMVGREFEKEEHDEDEQTNLE